MKWKGKLKTVEDFCARERMYDHIELFSLKEVIIEWAKEDLTKSPKDDFTKGYNKGIIKMLKRFDLKEEDLMGDGE